MWAINLHGGNAPGSSPPRRLERDDVKRDVHKFKALELIRSYQVG